MYKWLIIVLFLFSATASAATYKCVDDRGKTQYSDKPCPSGEGEEVELPTLSTFDSSDAASPGAPSPRDDGDDRRQIKYKVAITSPENDTSFWSNEGDVAVAISLEPPLDEDHQLVLLVDGSPSTSRVSGNRASVSGLERGAHSLQVVVQEGSKRLASSAIVQIHINKRAIRRANRR